MYKDRTCPIATCAADRRPRFGLERRRRYFGTDCLHTTVVLSEGIPARPHNNAMATLRRMNDDGEFVTV